MTGRRTPLPALVLPVLALLALGVGCRAPRVLDGATAMDAELRRHVPEAAAADPAAERARIEARLADGLSLEDALRIALVRNADLLATYEELSIAHADVVQAGLPPNPALDLSLRFLEGGGGEILETALVQPLVGWLLAPSRRRVASARLCAVRARLLADALRVVGDVRRGWYDVVAAEQRVGLHRSATLAARAAREAAAALREAGNITLLDLHREEDFYQMARMALASAQLAAYEARERLNLRMGLGGALTGWTIADRLPDLPADAPLGEDFEREVVAASQDLAAGRAAMVALGHELGLVRTGSALRELAVGATAEREDDGTWSVGPVIAVEIPIFDHGQAAVPAARARLRQARLRYLARAVAVRTEARLARAALGAAERQARHAQDVWLPLRQQILAETQAQANAMQVGVFHVLAAKRDLLAAGEAYVDTLHAYWRARSVAEQLRAGALPMGADAKGD